MDDQWNGCARTYHLKDARVVAVLDEDGGAVVENLPILEISEGRMETYSTDGKGQSTSSLDYGLMFGPKTEAPGDRHISFGAAIVIRGMAENGRLMEIRGHGFIGHDELGQLDGAFHDVPTVYVPGDEDLREHVERIAGEWGPEPQGDFVLATYGRAQDWT